MNKRWLTKITKILLAEADAAHKRLMAGDPLSVEEIRGDDGDTAQALYRAQIITRFQQRDMSHLRKIENSLAKIKNGTFGICEECEEPIALKRMEARPITDFCVECKETKEKSEDTFFGG